MTQPIWDRERDRTLDRYDSADVDYHNLWDPDQGHYRLYVNDRLPLNPRMAPTKWWCKNCLVWQPESFCTLCGGTLRDAA